MKLSKEKAEYITKLEKALLRLIAELGSTETFAADKQRRIELATEAAHQLLADHAEDH